MKIGELAKRTGHPMETVRCYERERLLPEPARSEGSYRQYALVHVECLSFIHHCRSLDTTQEEICTLLTSYNCLGTDCSTANRLIDEHLRCTEVRIAELQALREQLQDLGSHYTVAGNGQTYGILREPEQPASLSLIPKGYAGVGYMHVLGMHRQYGWSRAQWLEMSCCTTSSCRYLCENDRKRGTGPTSSQGGSPCSSVVTI